MKGLLLKDFYLSWRYCRAFIVIVAVFLAVSFTGDDNIFFPDLSHHDCQRDTYDFGFLR